MIAERKAAFSAKFREFKSHKKDVQKKLLVSAGLSAGIIIANWVGIGSFALKEADSVGKWLPPGGWMLGLGYGAQIASSAVSLVQEPRLLNRIGMNQNIGETAAYYGLEKIKPLKEKGRRSVTAVLSTTALSLAWIIPREVTLASVALSNGKMQELAVLKSTQAFFGFSQSGAAEVVLRTFGRKKKVEEPVKEKAEIKHKVPSSGLVFQAQRVPVPVVAGD